MSVKELFGLQAAYEARNGVKPELKCCPFCGEPGEVHTWTPLGKPMQRYGCAPCNVFKTTAEAWNRRAQPAEEVQKNAERYRWLRDPMSGSTRHDPKVYKDGPQEDVEWAYGEELDAMVDEAKARDDAQRAKCGKKP